MVAADTIEELGSLRTRGEVAMKNEVEMILKRLSSRLEQEAKPKKVRYQDNVSAFGGSYSAANSVVNLENKFRQISSFPHLSESNTKRISQVLETVWGLQPGQIIDVGGGSGAIAVMILSFLEKKDIPLKNYLLTDIQKQFESPNFTPKVVRECKQYFDLDIIKSSYFDVFSSNLSDLIDLEIDSLFLLLEVIEHVPNPEKFLSKLSATLPLHSKLLLTTPLLGSLETTRGHINVYPTMRLLRMFEKAGLEVENTWTCSNQWSFWILRKVITNGLAEPIGKHLELKKMAAVKPKLLESSPGYRVIYDSRETQDKKNDSLGQKLSRFNGSRLVETGERFSGIRCWFSVSGFCRNATLEFEVLSQDETVILGISMKIPSGFHRGTIIRKAVSSTTYGNQEITLKSTELSPRAIRIRCKGIGAWSVKINHLAFGDMKFDISGWRGLSDLSQINQKS